MNLAYCAVAIARNRSDDLGSLVSRHGRARERTATRLPPVPWSGMVDFEQQAGRWMAH